MPTETRRETKRALDRPYLATPTGPPPARTSRPLAVVIITYKSHDLVSACLARVATHLPHSPVFVYENTGDGYPGRHELAARHPSAHFVLGETNIGFAAAVNALVSHVPADHDLLLLNPDARLLGPLTRTRALLTQPGVAAVSPLIVDDAGAGAHPWDVATRHRTLTRALVAAAGRSDALRGTPWSHLYRGQPDERTPVEGYLSGACLAVNRDAWHTLGGFDEEFFLYGEETDWQTRARTAGWTMLLADEVGAHHGDDPPDEPAEISAASTPYTSPNAQARSRGDELLRANIALLLEHRDGVHHADAYLAGTTALDHVMRSRRRERRATRVAHRRGHRQDRPHVIITTNRLVYGGAERQKTLLAEELDRRGYPVTLVCLQRFGPLIRHVPPTVRVLRQPWWCPTVDTLPGAAVVISGDTNTEAGFSALWRAGGRARRWLVAAHVPPGDGHPIYAAPLTAAMRRADGFVALADAHWKAVSDQHRLGRRHYVAPNGVARRSQLSTPTRPAPDGPLHLVMLTRLVEHKNPHILVAALAGLADRAWTLSIYGDGPDRDMLAARTPASVADRVRWRGWSDGPEAALADADLLCVPSRSEAFPMVILEAMQRGVPVAASAVCAVPEMLDFGRAGVVVSEATLEAWQAALAPMLDDPAGLPDLGRRGFDRMASKYTVDTMADAYEHAIAAVHRGR